MVLGALSTALTEESKAYTWAKGQYKGIVRNFLIEKFGHLLSIDYIDGRDVVILTETVYKEKASKKKSTSKAKEAVKVPDTSIESNQINDKQPQLEEDLSLLSVNELSTFKLIMQLVFSYCGNTIGGSISRLAKKTKDEENVGLTGAIDNMQLSMLASLVRNKTMKEVIGAHDIDVIINAITQEQIRRGVISEEARDSISGETLPKQPIEVIANPEFDGLDDWLPF